jgi:hypothetical protein
MSRSKDRNVFVNRNAKTEKFKRPDHPDFMDASELKKIKFSGLRSNQIGLQTEIWVLGDIRATIPFSQPLSELEKKYREVFGFHPDDIGQDLSEVSTRHTKK